MLSLFETISRLYSAPTSNNALSESSNSNSGNNTREVIQDERFNISNSIEEGTSFIKRAWGKVESVFTQRQETTILPTHLTHFQEIDDEDDEFVHSNPFHQHNNELIYRGSLLKRRLSQHSQELISAIPEEDPNPSIDWNSMNSLQQYDGWRNDLLDIEQSQEVNVKNMVAGWAMGEASPWFD